MRNIERQILHVDVNNAFLSWTALERLENGETLDIRTIPSIIGGDETKRSGIVLAKSTKAKELGIVTGEPIYQARKKCPTLQVYASSYSTYVKQSNKLYQLLLEYTDKIERFSIDECFLDMTEFLMQSTLLEKAQEISKRVKNELGFTVNIGVAHNKLLAKMASDFTKPDKIHTLFEEEIPTKMWPLPARELFMIGKKSAEKLQHMQVHTIRDLAQQDPKTLMKKFGKHGLIMWEYANGIDKSPVQYEEEKPKGIGNSVTLPADVTQTEKIEEILLALTEHVTYRLRKHNLLANVVNVQLRTHEFKDWSHQKKLDAPTASTKIIYTAVKELLAEMYTQKQRIRLVGVRVDNLVEKEQRQLTLFSNEQQEKQEKLDGVVDALKNKYGYKTITRAGDLHTQITLKGDKE